MSEDPDEENPLQRWIDAEERWGDPDSPGAPSDADVDPSNSSPESEDALSPAPDPDELPGADLTDVEVDSRTKKYFWGAVVLANVALAAVSLGLLLIGFRGQWLLGGGLVFLGLLAGVRTYRLSREYTQEDAEGT